MKKLLLSISVSMFFGVAAHAFVSNSGVCANFIPEKLMGSLQHVERNGICYIDDIANINDLNLDVDKSLRKRDFNTGLNAIPLFIGKAMAVLVKNDVIYSLEQGNEQNYSAPYADTQRVNSDTVSAAQNHPSVTGAVVGVVVGTITESPGAGAIVGSYVSDAISNSNENSNNSESSSSESSSSGGDSDE